VEHGGGDTHRFRLDDCVLIKDNHLALGVPAKPVRECRDAEHEYMRKEHERTLSKAKVYKKIYEG